MPNLKSGYKLVKTLFGKYEEIPEDWKYLQLHQITEQDICDGPHETPKFHNNGIPFFSVDTIQDNTIVLDDLRYISKTDHAKFSKKCKPKKFDILLGKAASIGKVAFVNFDWDFNVWSPLAVIRINNENSKKFFYYFILSNFIQKQIKHKANTNTQGNIGLRHIKQFMCFTPPKNEQQKIASILGTVDDLINKYDEIIKTTKKLKTGLMQQLLTKGIDHKKFKKVKWYATKEISIPETWTMTTIGKEFNISAGGTPKTNNRAYFNGNIPWITSSNLNRGYVDESTALITEEAVKKTNLKIYPKGSFIIAAIGVDAVHTRGNCGILKFDASINQVCVGFEKLEQIDIKFFFHFYLHFGSNLILTYYQGTKQWAFYPYIIKKIPIPLPSINEQKQIAFILSNIDSKISKLESKKKSIQKIKKGLMQKLLTGKMRVKSK